MIKHMGNRSLRISRLRKPENWDEICKSDQTRQLARSIEDSGGKPLHPPVVRNKDKSIIAGRHRIAALALLGNFDAECKLIDCTVVEAELLAAIEDAHRRHDISEMNEKTLRLIEMAAAVAEQEGLGPRLARSRAKREVAVVLGKSHDAVRKRAQRAENARAAAVAAAIRGPAPSTVHTWGLPTSVESMSRVTLIQEHIKDSVFGIRKAKVALRKIVRGDLPFPKETITTIEDLLVSALELLDRSTPVALCPYCKSRAEYVDDCLYCIDHPGWGSEADLDRAKVHPKAPGEVLVRDEEPCVLVRGQVIVLAPQHEDEAM